MRSRFERIHLAHIYCFIQVLFPSGNDIFALFLLINGWNPEDSDVYGKNVWKKLYDSGRSRILNWVMVFYTYVMPPASVIDS